MQLREYSMASASSQDQFRFFSIHDFGGAGSIHWSWERDTGEESETAEHSFDTFSEAVADAFSHGFSEESLPPETRLSDLIDLAPRIDRRGRTRSSGEL